MKVHYHSHMDQLHQLHATESSTVTSGMNDTNDDTNGDTNGGTNSSKDATAEVEAISKIIHLEKQEIEVHETKLNNLHVHTKMHDYYTVLYQSNEQQLATAATDQPVNQPVNHVLIHKGGVSQHGNYEMATRYKSTSFFSKRKAPIKKIKSKITSTSTPQPFAPLWPGTQPIDILSDHTVNQSSATEIVVDFGLLIYNRKKEKEILFENCTETVMNVLLDGSSSMYGK